MLAETAGAAPLATESAAAAAARLAGAVNNNSMRCAACYSAGTKRGIYYRRRGGAHLHWRRRHVYIQRSDGLRSDTIRDNKLRYQCESHIYCERRGVGDLHGDVYQWGAPRFVRGCRWHPQFSADADLRRLHRCTCLCG